MTTNNTVDLISFNARNAVRNTVFVRFGVMILIACFITSCAWLDEEFIDQTGIAQPERQEGGGGRMPDANRVQMMRQERMTSLNQAPGGGVVNTRSSSVKQNKTPSSTNKAPKEDTSFLKAGKEAYNVGDYKEAENKLKQFIDKYSASDSTPEALFFLGETYFRVKNYKKALTTYKKIDSEFSPYPKAGEALYKAGKCLEMLGQGSIAKRVFKKVTTKYPSFNPDNIID